MAAQQKNAGDPAFWQGHYDRGHTPWELGEASPAVCALVEGHFPPEGRVLVPGCGRGHDALLLAQKGFRVSAVDFVPAAIGWLQQTAGQAGLELEALCADLFAGDDDFTGRFDLLLENGFLCALPPKRRRDYEPLAHRVLKPGGQLLGVFLEVPWQGGPPFHCPSEWVWPLFPPERWRAQGPWPQPPNPRRPGPEYLAVFTKIR